MDRRTFTKCSALSVLSYAAVPPLATLTHQPIQSPDTGFIKQLLYLNDQYIPSYLEQQENDAHHRWFGGIIDTFGIHNPQSTANFIQTLACAMVSPESDYYKSTQLIDPLERAANYLVKAQHADGTLDLYSTNFHSTPDTGFEVNRLSPVYVLFQRLQWAALANLQESLKTFLLRAGEALYTGGIHTPNHRWVVSAALAWLHYIFPNEQYIKRIDQWLNEGIDIDAEGQFNEKSTAIYSPLTNRMFIFMARLLDRPALLEPVRKNLEMTFYYLHPNAEVVTEASGRQDQYQIGYTDGYYYPYRFLAIKDDHPQFAAACHLIEKAFLPRLTGYLHFFLEDPTMGQELPPPADLPANYLKSFPNTGMVRIRRNNTDATIIANNATFFTFHKGQAVLQAVRIAAAFFGKGQFIAEAIEENNHQFVLLQKTLQGPYYQPYPAEILPSDGDWDKMPRHNRNKSEIQTLDMKVMIVEDKGTCKLTIDIKGTDNVPVTVELGFRPTGTLSNVSTVEGIPAAFLLENGYGRYQLGNDVITFGPGQAAHRWTQLRGALPKLEMQSVYLTGFTPFYQTIEFS